jgi:hypothetical protein
MANLLIVPMKSVHSMTKTIAANHRANRPPIKKTANATASAIPTVFVSSVPLLIRQATLDTEKAPNVVGGDEAFLEPIERIDDGLRNLGAFEPVSGLLRLGRPTPGG